MTTLDDWPRVKRVLAGALECEGTERQSYLDAACGSDAELRSRVDRLLAAADGAQAFLEAPTAMLLDAGAFEDLSGRVVETYRLLSRLGAGGTGQVYLAHDTKLDRPVALKLLAPDLAADRDRVRRFHQEARAASGLNHPHIVVVHDFGELEGRPYLVTELVEGETLRERLRRGPLAVRDVVEIGVQVAGALAAAHARGLVHRDVKPENVMVRPDGYAKVLDFGLAKLAAAPAGDTRTRTGTVLGTPRYMSPEQARGLDLDARTDVWSLGVVLYEMATGALPFADDGALVAGTLPPELLPIVSKALHTVRDLRHPSGAELCADLKRLQGALAASPAGEAHGSRRPHDRSGLEPRAWVLAAGFVVALGALLAVPWMRGRGTPVPTGAQKSVAVLPFDNVGGDVELDYLRLALADVVATALSEAPSIVVRPLASSWKLVVGTSTPQQAGRELHAGRVVTGQFSAIQSELQVTVEAVEVEGNRLLWRETFAAPAAESIALRDRLTSRIRDGLLPALGAPAPTVTHVRPRNAEAYSLYLKSLAHSGDPGPNREAIAMLERASTIDPDHVDTWAALGVRYYDDAQYGAGGGEAFRRSEAALRQALALDAGHVPAAVELLGLQIDAGRLQDAYDGARKLVARRPDSGEAHFALNSVLRYGGLLEEAAVECEQAVTRDPTNPGFRTCSATFIQLGRYDRALDFVRLDSGSEWSRMVTRWVYQRLGRRHDAREQHRQQSPGYPPGLVPASFHGFIARCLSAAVPSGAGRLSDDEVGTFLTLRDSEPLYFFAGDLASCGDPAAAIRLLRESILRNYCASRAIETDPEFASIRDDPGYGELLGAARACRDRFEKHVRARSAG